MNLYVLCNDGDGHSYAVLPKDEEKFNQITEKDWEDWTEEDQDFIDSQQSLDGDEYFIVLKSELNDT